MARNSGLHVSSLSRNAINSLRAARIPVLRAALGPRFACSRIYHAGAVRSNRLLEFLGIGRSVVHHDHFEFGKRLGEDTIQRFGNVRRRIVRRNDNAHFGVCNRARYWSAVGIYEMSRTCYRPTFASPGVLAGIAAGKLRPGTLEPGGRASLRYHLGLAVPRRSRQ